MMHKKNNGDIGAQYSISSFSSVDCEINSFSPVIEHRSPSGWCSVGAARPHCQVSPGGLSDWSLGSSSCHRSSQAEATIAANGVQGLGNSWTSLMERGDVFSFFKPCKIFPSRWIRSPLAKMMDNETRNFSHCLSRFLQVSTVCGIVPRGPWVFPLWYVIMSDSRKPTWWRSWLSKDASNHESCSELVSIECCTDLQVEFLSRPSGRSVCVGKRSCYSCTI